MQLIMQEAYQEHKETFRDLYNLRLPPRCIRDLPYSGKLCTVC